MPATFGRSLLFLSVLLALATPARAQLTPPPIPVPSPTPTPAPAPTVDRTKLDPLMQDRVSLTGRSRVIVRATDPASLGPVAALIQQVGGVPGRQLPIIDAVAAEIPDVSLAALTASQIVRRIALDRVIRGTLNRTAATIGAAAARQEFGYDGSGIGVAVIDSGVAPWHDDLTAPGIDGAQRVDAFVDFVQGRTTPYDDYGHGTHVAGIIAGNGFDSGGARAGVAPGARLVVLKVLDQAGRGRISDVIAAIGYAVEHKDAFRIRIINLSIGAGVFESYLTDMLTLAARGAVDQGILVVASAGNAGRDSRGRTRYGGITAPGNAPWVLTVGASSHMGTVDRADDTIASFSSRGPTAIDRAAKPDLVAPGVGIESLTDPTSTLFSSKAPYLLNGTVQTAYAPYLSLSGTSQAAPVVAGIAALMLQADPALTPNAVKALLQYTAETHSRYDALTQGAGFVDARGAVEFTRFLANPDVIPPPAFVTRWGRQLIWGNFRVRPDRLGRDAEAWGADVAWGARVTPHGHSIAWNGVCVDGVCLSAIAGTSTIPSLLASPITGVTSTAEPIIQSDNVVWGTACGGASCTGIPWTQRDGLLWGACAEGDTVVWGSSDGETVVWGSSDAGDTVVWGSSDDGDTVVWGSSDDGDTVVWGSSGDEDVLWDRGGEEPAPEPVC